ncbi:MAG: type IA DNA topoisomerase, partial [Clostridia bacterium]|nr:type IA DNA topoisomerase [Clostridia bacterium]
VFAAENPDGSASEVKATLNSRFKTEDEVMEFLEKCKTAQFTVETITKKPMKRMPAPPFTTSTLQQEAARKLGYSNCCYEVFEYLAHAHLFVILLSTLYHSRNEM